jgi:hypothetical protein
MKRIFASALLALMAFSTEAAYSAPTRNAATLRALRCCATHCDRARPAAAAARCCGVTESEVAAPAQPKGPAVAPALHATLVELEPFSGCERDAHGRVATARRASARGAPLFLLTHSLRI